MKIFDRLTKSEILPKFSSKQNGSCRVNECLNESNNIINIIFGVKCRNIINGDKICKNIIFNKCEFNHVDFLNLYNQTFIDCVFKNCYFYNVDSITMRNCSGINTIIAYPGYICGKCEFTNCFGISFTSDPDEKLELIIENSPEASDFLEYIKRKKLKSEKEKQKILELRKSIKYGYKIVNAPILVKLSFPDDARIVNINKDKSRCDYAKVESVTIVNDFGGNGVVNKAKEPCKYEVGEFVYPDRFDPNPNNECGHGIHFCKDIENLPIYTCISDKELEVIKHLI